MLDLTNRDDDLAVDHHHNSTCLRCWTQCALALPMGLEEQLLGISPRLLHSYWPALTNVVSAAQMSQTFRRSPLEGCSIS